MKYFRPLVCVICALNTCFLIDYMVIMDKQPTETPVLLVLLGLLQMPIVWWFRSRDKAKEREGVNP